MWMLTLLGCHVCRTSSPKVIVSPSFDREVTSGISKISVTYQVITKRNVSLPARLFTRNASKHSVQVMHRLWSHNKAKFPFSFTLTCSLRCYQRPSWWTFSNSHQNIQPKHRTLFSQPLTANYLVNSMPAFREKNSFIQWSHNCLNVHSLYRFSFRALCEVFSCHFCLSIKTKQRAATERCLKLFSRWCIV